MQSTFSGVEIAKRAIFAQSRSLNTVGHNLSNMNTEGYSKQRVHLASTIPLYMPDASRAESAGTIGQGVDIAAISRQRDIQIDTQIVFQGHKEGYWATRDKYLGRLEEIYNEVGDSSIRNMFDRFWESWQEVATFPEQISARQVLLERADTLSAEIRDRDTQLQNTRAMLNEEIGITVGHINQYAKDIAQLNNTIKRSKAVGDAPNDLMDKRDLLIEKLSPLINIAVDRRDPDELLVHMNGKVLVQGDIARQFEAQHNVDRNADSVFWSDTQKEVSNTGGVLSSLVKLRDQDVRGEIQSLNTFAITLMDAVNSLHTGGITLNGESGENFFVETPAVLNTQGNYDGNQDGNFDQTRLYRISGLNTLDKNQQVGFAGVVTLPGANADKPVTVEYFGTDTVQNVIDKINGSGAEVIASLDSKNKLVLRATASNDIDNPDFVIRGLEDSGEFLAGYAGILTQPGTDGAYTWKAPNEVDTLLTKTYGVAPFLNPAGSFTINQAIFNDPRKVAAATPSPNSRTGEVGDGSMALAISHLRTANMGLGTIKTFDDYFADTVASIASRGQEAELHHQTQTLIMNKLRDRQASGMSVDLDEELQDMIKFQTAYAAAARFLTGLNSIYDTLLAI